MLFSKTLLTLCIAVGLAVSPVAAKRRDNIYLIRHGERPVDDFDYGLAEKGKKRTACISNIFSDPKYNIGLILVQKPKSTGRQGRPLLTVTPLAEKLGLKVDSSCDRGDEECVEEKVEKFQRRAANKGKGVLICWERAGLESIADELDISNEHDIDWPGERFDLIWSIKNGKMVSSKQACPGL